MSGGATPHLIGSTTIVRVERFRELAPGGRAAVIQLVNLFLQQMREQLQCLVDAIDRDGAEEVELIAHRCAGTSATCGADTVAAPLLALEALAKTGALQGAAQHLADAREAFGRAELFLLGYLAGLSDTAGG